MKKMDMFRKITEETVNDDTLVTIKQEPLTDGTVAGNSLTVGNSEVIKVVKVEPADGTVAGNSLTAGNSEVKQVVKVEPADGTVAGNSLTAGNSEVIQVVKVEPAATDKVDELIVVDVKTEPNQYITAGDQSDTAVVSGGRTEISSFEIIDKLQSIQSHLQFMTSEQTHEHSLEYDSCLTVEGKSSGLVHAKNVQEQADKVRPMEGVQTETDTTERIKNEDGEFTVVAEWGVDVDRVDNRGKCMILDSFS